MDNERVCEFCRAYLDSYFEPLGTEGVCIKRNLIVTPSTPACEEWDRRKMVEDVEQGGA